MPFDRSAAAMFNLKQIANGQLNGERITALVEYWQQGHGLAVDGKAGTGETLPSIDWELHDNVLPPEPTKTVTTAKRGTVVALTDAQIVQRALYFAGKASIDTLDEHVRKLNAPKQCPVIYYLLKGHNGGKDPTAPDPADRWTKPDSDFVNVTADCSGANSWMGGFDRYQPIRMRPSIGGVSAAQPDGGWFNTDTKYLDATRPVLAGEKRCFEADPLPNLGRIIVCMSGSPGHSIGHEGRIVGYRGDIEKFDPKNRAHWDLIDVVDCSSQGPGNRANLLHTGRGWFGTNALFLKSVMPAG